MARGCGRKSVGTHNWEAAWDDGSMREKVLGFRVGNETRQRPIRPVLTDRIASSLNPTVYGLASDVAISTARTLAPDSY